MKSIQLLKQDIRIPLLLLRSFLSAFFPAMAFVTVYMMHNLGLSLAQVMTLQSVYMFSVAFFEVPTGIIGDKYSRKLSIIIGAILYMLGWSIYLFKLKFIFYAFAEFLMGIAGALTSGSDSALEYDIFKENKLEKYYSRFVSMTRIAVLLAFISGGIFTAIFYSKLGLRGIWLISMFTTPLEILTLILIKEPKIHDSEQKLTPNYKWYIKQMLNVIKSSKLLQFMIFLVLIFGQARYFVNWATQPLFLYFKIPVKYFEIILLTVISTLGIIVHSILIKYEKKIKITIKFTSIVLLSNILLFNIGILLAKLVHPSTIVLIIIVFRLISQEFGNLFQSLLHPFIPSKTRATVLSGVSLTKSLLFSITNPFIGYLMDIHLIKGSLALMFGLFLLGSFLYGNVIRLQEAKKL